MDVSIVSSSDEVCCSPKLFDKSAKKTRSAAAEEGCTNLHAADQYGRARLHTSSIILFQVTLSIGSCLELSSMLTLISRVSNFVQNG